MKNEFKITPFANASGTTSYRVSGTMKGKHVRHNFPDQALALTKKQVLECEAANIKPPEIVATRLTPVQCAEAETGFKLLENSKLSLLGAVEFALRNYVVMDKTITVADAFKQFMADKQSGRAHGLAEATKRKLTQRLKELVTLHGFRQLAEITAAQCEALIFREGSGAVNRHSDRAALMNFFNWAMFRKYVKNNPVKDTVSIKLDYGEPVVLSLAECRAVIHHAQLHECRALIDLNGKTKVGLLRGSTMPFIVLAMFCGLRVDEIKRLDRLGSWDKIDLAAQTITIGPEIAKGRSRRVVAIPDNALAFLMPHAVARTPLAPSNLRKRLNQVRKLAKLTDWTPDVFRHTAITYRLEQTGDENRTAAWAGNSPTIIHKHYRGLVRQADVAPFWDIKPDTDRIVDLKAA